MNLLATFSAFSSLFGVALALPTADAPVTHRADPVDAQARAAVIARLSEELEQNYVFVETAKKMEALIKKRQSEGAYDKLSDGAAFAQTLTADLQSVSHDKHMRVRYSAKVLETPPPGEDETPAQHKRFQDQLRSENGSFTKVERLVGNIGYIDFRAFNTDPICKAAAKAAFTFVTNTDALIIDMRKNGGGDPAMVAFMCSYLFGDKKIHINDIYIRPTNETTEHWTTPSEALPNYGDRPVYVLTSGRTFSGAEEFTYDLKVLKRATIVGETTGGGANPGGSVRLTDHFIAFVPMGRAINPITKTNWEGTGVEPDIKCPADGALKAAQLDALQKQLAKAKTDEERAAVQETIDQVSKG